MKQRLISFSTCSAKLANDVQRASKVQSGPAAFAYRTSTHLTTGVRKVLSEILTQRRPLGGTN
jgi:hypothetical protein